MDVRVVEPDGMVGSFKENDPVYRVVIMIPHPDPKYSYYRDEYRISNAASVNEVIRWCCEKSEFYKVMIDLGPEMEGTKIGRLFDLIEIPLEDNNAVANIKPGCQSLGETYY